jgi:RhtB (resistance to homoserine/threonine) family protein
MINKLAGAIQTLVARFFKKHIIFANSRKRKRLSVFDPATLLAYLAACIAIILAPGPAQALVLARTLSDGKKAGMMTAVGLNVGTLFHAVIAALGLSAILATSAVAFALVKYLGAAYLIYLGLQAFRAKANASEAVRVSRSNPAQAFFKAVIIGILNPKVALFFLAFLPQFVDPARGSALAQFLVLGSILAFLDVVYETVLAYVFSALSSRIARSSTFALWRQKITGAVLMGLGVRLALTQQE